jgi:outer membrane protein assembly factor BamB
LATTQCLTAFNFNPAAQDKLQVRWYHEIVEIDCDFEFLNVTTPAVLTTDQVVIGDNRGRVRSYHIDDGAELWTYEARVNGNEAAIRCPPVAGLRQIYVLTDGHLIVLDSDGEEMSRTALKGRGGGLSLSLDYVYAMTTEGIYTGSLDGNGQLIDRTFDDAAINETHFGSTVPAIDRNGNVYLATPAGFVFAYGPGLVTFSAPFPSVSWVAPEDGTTIYSSSQTMHVALNADEGFTGHVTISSDVDGVLCEFDATGASEGSCVPADAMSLGPHVLTAFATNSEGTQESAQITVDVIALPLE